MSDEEHRGRGALLGALGGGAIGAGAPSAANAISNLPKANLTQKIMEAIPQWQRFSLLTKNPVNLTANMWLGPYGSGAVDAFERGDWGLLKDVLNPVKFAGNWVKNLRGAGDVIGRAEGEALGSNPSTFRQVTSAPGRGMTAGDMSIRDVYAEHGYSDDIAREATKTNEPRFGLFKKMADFGKGIKKEDPTRMLSEVSFPFKRTNSNIIEQNLERIPGFGTWMQNQRGKSFGGVPDPWQMQARQQALDALIGYGGYQVGQNVDPETAKVVRKVGSNLAGSHGVTWSAMLAAGLANQAGRPAMGGSTVKDFVDALPMPSAQPLYDFGKAGLGLLKGQFTDPSTGKDNLPNSMKPFRDWPQYVQDHFPSMGGASAPPPTSLSSFRLDKSKL
jgi:hypothetical protein